MQEINDIIESFFLKGTQKNEAIILIGPICSGKTSYRKEFVKNTHILIDAGEIYMKLYGSSAGFGEHLIDELNYIGNEIVKKILINHYSFIMEIMPDQYKNIIKIAKRLQKLGYKVKGIKLDATEEEAIKRNSEREKNDISSYFTENFHIAWLLNNLK
jgi:predicted kinase